MAQDLTVNIKTTSEVPQAMDKAKQAVTGFSKQVEEVNRKTNQSAKQETEKASSQIDGIQKRFGSSFKDIFLSVLGPMALFAGAMAFIGRIIEENKKKHADANQAAIDGTNALMSAEDRYWARKRDRDDKSAKDKEQAAMSREDITKDFLLNDVLGRSYLLKKMYGESRKSDKPSYLKPFESASEREAAGLLATTNEAQMYVQLALKEKMRENPELGKATDFKGPEGFSNVVGVGANPVMEAMAEQTELARQQLAELQKLNAKGNDTQTDFTKDSK